MKKYLVEEALFNDMKGIVNHLLNQRQAIFTPKELIAVAQAFDKVQEYKEPVKEPKK
jgi:hypothetical protein